MDIRREIKKGIPSYCTGNFFVIQSLLRLYKNNDRPLLLEATANQVNQFGGYTGKTPLEFKQEVLDQARQIGFDEDRLIFGGDHLGPLVWRNSDPIEAMDRAETLVRTFTKAGYQKIHLDTSMQLGDERGEATLPVRTIAERGLRLIKACQEELKGNSNCVFIIGSEVPFPGGETSCDEMMVTHPKDALNTVAVYKEIFERSDVSEEQFNRDIIALVVQPGVEFTKDKIFPYSRENARNLMEIDKGELVFEGHSTDYQSSEALKNMFEDGVKILKVGPELTYLFRAALERLERFEIEILPSDSWSQFSTALSKAMADNPKYWEGYYSLGQSYDFEFSYLDRSRYYLTEPKVKAAIETLKLNVNSIDNQAVIIKFFPELSNEDVVGNLFEKVIDLSMQAVVRKYENAVRK